MIAVLAAGEAVLDFARSVLRIGDRVVMVGIAWTVIAGIAMVGLVVVAAARHASRQLAVLGIGFALMVALRGAAAIALDAPVDRDMAQYHALALGFATGECCFHHYPTGYPVLLALAYQLVSVGPLAGELVNLIAASIGGIALYRIVLVAHSAQVAGIALLLYALWPAGVLLTPVRLTETVYTSALLLATWVVVEHQKRWTGSAVLGAILAGAQYVRPTTAALLPAFLVARAWHSGGSRRSFLTAAAPVVVVFLLALTPVIERNLRVYGDLSIATSSYAGWTLFTGTNQQSGGTRSEADARLLPTLTEGDLWDDSKAAGELGLRRIADDPLGFVALAIRKFPTMWAHEDYGATFAISGGAADRPAYTFISRISQTFYAAVVMLASIGLYVRRRKPDILVLVVASITATVALVHTFVEVRDRYHAYLVPLFIAVAAPVATVGSRRVARRVRRLKMWRALRRRRAGGGDRGARSC